MKQKMKKRWLVIIALAVIAVVGGVLLYPAKPIQAAHTHSFNVSAATCTTAKKCRTCGYISQQALGHAYCQVTTKQPTCVAAGAYATKCSRCGVGSSTGNGTIPPTGHTWNRSSATCTASKSCTKCGTVGQAALGHAYCQVTTKQPTCGASGTYETKCSRCGVGSPTGNGTIPPTGQHSWNRSSASCTEAKKCVNCGTVGQAALGHAYSQVTTKQPTCGAAGTYETKCSRCGIGSPTGNGTIAPTGQHTWTYTSTTQPTCTANGYDLYTCSTCKQTKKETIGKLGHAYSQVTTKQPTCGAEGTYETKCSRCGIGSPTGNGTIAPTGKHAWKYTSTTESTCTANGYDLYTCSVCKQTKKETLDRIEHKYRLVVTKQPTKTENGVQSYMCSHCDAVKSTKALYLVSYDGNGAIKGTTPGNQTKVSGSNLTLSIVAPRRTGYNFKGWGTTTSEVKYQPGDTYDKNARMNLYAIWEPYQYTIEFDVNGGNGSNFTRTIAYGSTYSKVDKPSRTGYTFAGWYTAKTGGSQITETTIMSTAKDHTVYARWTAKTYTVTFDANGGTGGPTSMKKTYGTASVIPEEVPTMNGYRCIGWAETQEDADAKKVKYKKGDYFTRNKEMTLYAVWGLHPFFENNPRFKPTKEIQEPYNHNVQDAKAIPDEAYQYVYDNRCKVKYKPKDMTDDEYLDDIINRSLGHKIAAEVVELIPFLSKAGEFLDHYLSGSGEKVTYSADALYLADATLHKAVEEQKLFIQKEIEKYLEPGETITFVDSDAAGTIVFTKNGKGNESLWATLLNFPGFLALRSCSYGLSGTCSLDGERYRMECKFYLQDYYDFYSKIKDSNDQSDAGFLFVKNDELAYLHLRKIAQAFENTGIINLNAVWYAAPAPSEPPVRTGGSAAP